jgi:hypothetical protein
MASRPRIAAIAVLAFAFAGVVPAACSVFETADDGVVAPPVEAGGDALDATGFGDPDTSIIVDAAVETGGENVPVVIASGMGNPLAIVLTDQRVAWATASQALSCSKTKCTPVALPLTGAGLTDLTGAPDDLFAAAGGGTNGHVARLDPNGGGYTRFGGQISPYPFIVAANTTLVTALNTSGFPDAGGVYKMAHDGGTFGQVASQLVGSTNHNWYRMVVLPDRVLVRDYSYIYACPLPSCPGGWTLFAGGAAQAVQLGGGAGLATNGTEVFWTSSDKPGVYRCALNAAPCGLGSLIATKAAFGGERPEHIVFHGGALHITTPKGALYRCTAPACNDITRIAIGADTILGRPAVDDTAYYWLSRDAVDGGADAGDSGVPVPYRVLKLMR